MRLASDLAGAYAGRAHWERGSCDARRHETSKTGSRTPTFYTPNGLADPDFLWDM